MNALQTSRPPLPPFTLETAIQKVRLAEDGWNSRDPEKVALAYAIDSVWRNRSEFMTGREEIVQFLKRKWARNWIIGLSKKYGLSVIIGSLCVSLTSFTMTAETGSDLTVTKIGNSIRMGS